MKTTPLRKLIALIVFAALGLLFPCEARADAIDFGFVAVAGGIVLIPLMAFEVFVEGIFLAIGLRIPYRRTLWLALAANFASLVAGIPVKIFNSWMYSVILPHPLAPYFIAYPWAILLGSLIFFIVTLIVEYLVVARWCYKKMLPVSRRRIALFVLIANRRVFLTIGPEVMELHYKVFPELSCLCSLCGSRSTPMSADSPPGV